MMIITRMMVTIYIYIYIYYIERERERERCLNPPSPCWQHTLLCPPRGSRRAYYKYKY